MRVAVGAILILTLQPARAQYAGGVWTAVPDFGSNAYDGLNSKLSQNGQVRVFSCWGGPLFRSLNGGTSWNQTLTGITANGIAMSSNGQKIFLAVRDLPIHVSTNSGTNWSPVSGLSNFWTDVDCSADGQIAIACRGNTGTVHVTTNGGLNSVDWTEQSLPGGSNIQFVACSSDGSKRFAASSNGFLYTWNSVDGWVQRDSSRSWAGLTASADGTKLAATVGGGNIYTSTDSGVTWTARATSESWTRIDSTDDGSVLITSVSSGTAKGLYTSYDSGVTWTLRASSLNPANPLHWRGASVSGDGTRMFAPIGGGTAPQALYLSDTTPAPSQAPAGTDKTVFPVGGTYSFTKADFGFTDPDSPANNFTAVKITTVPNGSLTLSGNPVTAGQVIPVTTGPAGATWTSTAPPSDYPTSFGLSEDGSTIVMTGWNGGIYRSTDGGGTWANRLSASFRGAIAITPDGTRIIAVQRPGAVFTSTDSGVTFVSQGTNRFYTSVAISNDGMKAIAGTDGGALYLTTDGGVTWNAVTDPTPGTGNWTDVASSADGTKLIASKYNGNLYTSTDSGATWTARETARTWFGVSSSADGTKLAAAVNGGNLYTSTDSGATWTARATSENWGTINSSSDGNVLVATVGSGNVYTSTDAGLNWTARDSSRNWVASGISYNGEKMIAGVGGASGGLPAVAPQVLISNGTPPVLPVWTGSSTTSFTFQVRDDGSTANGGVTEDASPNTMTLEIPNNAPTDISLSSSAIDENAGANGVVGALTATDADSGDTHTFSLVAGTGSTDNASFNISGNNLRLNTSADYETKTSYSVRIEANDGKGGTYQKAFTVTVNNLNDVAPEVTALTRYLITGGANANANAMRLMRLNADGSAILANTALPSLALSGGSGNAVYNPSSGYLVFGGNTLNLDAYLAGGTFAVSAVSGLVNNSPWSAHVPSGRFLTPRRNGTGLAPVETLNPLTGSITSGGTHTAFIPEASWIYNSNLYTLNEGYSLLQIPVASDGSTTGSMTSSPTNFTTALGIPHGNVGYTETSRLAIDPSDGTALFSNGFQNLYLFDFDGPYAPGGYTLINLHSHLVTSGGGFTYNPALTNGFNVTYDSVAGVFYAAGSLSNGTDYRGFLVRITKAGAVTVLAQELAGDPVYTGFLAGLAYAPVSGNTFSLTENSANGTAVGTLSATDGDAGATTFSDWTITGGNTGGAFAINASTGQITVANTAAIDFETTPTFNLTATVSDGVNTSAPIAVTINLNNANEPATDITLTNDTVLENEPANTVIGTLAATGDPDAGSSQTLSLVAGTGSTDNAAFNISGNDLRLTGSANFEAKSSYSIRLRATDNLGATYDEVFAISVVNVNEAPTSISLSATSLPENGGANAVVGTISAIGDPDAGASHAFTLVAGIGDTDNAAFNISGGSSLRLTANGDYEVKPSYSIRLRANDGLGGSVEQQFTINVTNVNEPPTGLDLSNSSVTENGSLNATVGSLTATGDPDAGASHTYSLVAGAGDTDNLSFNILGNALRLTGVADFETKASYSVRIQASDGNGGTYANSFTITVNNLPEGATDITLTNASLSENNTPPTTVGTLAATGDPNPLDTHTFSLVAGAGDTDNGSFLINGSTLRLNVAANFEVKTSYSIRVQADDGTGGLFARSLIVSITNVNEPPTDLSLSNTVLPENSGGNAIIGTVSAIGDPDAGATHVFTLVTGTGSTDNTLFNLTGSTLRKVTNADFEDRSSYSIRIRADDGLGGVFEKSFSITVTDVNEAPTDITLSGNTVPENAGANTVIGSFAALGDPDAGAMHSFSLVSGTGSTDNAAFNISGNTLRLSASADFEAKPTYSIRVQASDLIDGTFEKVFTISVTNVNEPPTDISLSNATVPENAGANAVVGTVAAIGDPDAGASHTYSLVAGTGDTDNAAFNLSGAVLRLTASADFEAKSFYSVRVRADDGAAGTFEKAFTITVTNVNEAPTDLTINDATVDENAGANAIVGAFTTVGDPDAGAVHTYTLVSGVDDDDNSAFNINGSNLRLTASANFEVKSSYKVRVRTDDGLLGTFEKAFTITINNVNEAPTDLTLGNSSVPENAGANAVVGALTATGDPDAGAVHTYSLVAGPGDTDNAAFNIDGASLRLTASANFEVKSSYSVRVLADDGLGGTFAKAFAITITNVNESPTDISLSNASLPENAGANAVVGALSAIGDPDAGATHTFAFVSGPGDTDNGAFILSGNSLRLSASADFETKPSYSVRVEANDGLGGTFAKAFTIMITNVNEAPTDISLSNTTVPENGGINLVVGTFAALGDPDPGAAHAFTLVAGTGSTDNASFNISGQSLRLNASADFEVKSSYSVRVEANDGLGGVFAKAFTILISNVNEPPTDISLSNASVPENAGINALVGNLSALGDPDGGASHSFTLVSGTGGTDNADFNISGASLRLNTSANFEAKALYQIRVRADDGAGGIYEKPFVINITDVNEAPSVTNVNATGDEDSPGITVTFSGSDPDSNPLTYSIVTGPLPAEGTLGPVGANSVVFTPAANFNGVVNFTYKATDGSLESNTGTATVTVNAVNDPPTITDISGLTILEDGTTGPLAFAIGDVDAGAVLSVNASTNNQILAPDGELVLGGSGSDRTITVTPEPDQNGAVTVTVQVSDGLLTAQDTFVVTVTAVNDEPTFDLSTWPLFSALDPNAEGRLWAWGLNNDGQIGDGSVGTASQPVQVGSQTDWQQLAAGDSYTFAVKSDGTLWSWGDNFYGQLGDGTTSDRDVPVPVGDEEDWDVVSAGDGHVVALKTDGTLWTWGRNDYGQLGNGATSAVSAPQQIGSDMDWRSVSAGSLHTVALKSDGSLWAWGRNQFGQLGTGSTTSSSVPVRIGTANDWMTIAAGGLHTLAMKTDGSLWAWGRNADGQIGDGTTNPSNAPKQIGIDTDWVQIASGYTYSLAQKADGSIWAWGRNSDGQIGDGTRTNRLAPQQIGVDTDWALIAAGRYHGLALKTDGSLWTWGDNDTYQMGIGTIGDLLVPTRLGTDTWTAIAGGLGHTVAIEPESMRLTIAANSGPFLLPGFATNILAGPLDEQSVQNVTFEVSNDDNGLFVTQPAIAPDGSLTLTPGVDAGTLTVTARAKDDGGVANGGDDTSVPKTFSITITVAPEITLTGNSVEILNGDDTPDVADHTDFEETPTVGGSVVRTFTIFNDGTAPLLLGNIALNGSSAFSVTTPPASNTVDRLGGFQTFSITFDPATPGLHTTEVSIVSDDDDENPFVFDLAGVGITPEMSVTGNANEIPNGDVTPFADDHTDFGDTEVTGGSVSRTFTILNTGTQDLTLSGVPIISLTGSAAFSVTTMPATNPVPKTSGATPFVILFDPASRGVHNAVVSIANNDEDEAPYTFAIRGTGLAPEISLSGNGSEIPSGDTTPSVSDHTLFGSIGTAMTRTFTIVNEGNLVMNLGTPAVSVSGSASFSVQSQPVGSTVSADGGTQTFEIVFDPAAPGEQTATVSVASDDTDENPYTFTVRGNGLTQLTVSSFRAVIGSGRINLATLVGASPAGGIFSGPGVEGGAFNPNVLAPGDYTLKYTVKDAIGQDLETDITVTVELSPARLTVGRPKSFATTTVGSSSRPQLITIENVGGKSADSVRVVLSGKGARDFRVKQPGTTIRGGGKDSFQVTFSPRKDGVRKAKATILSNAGPVSINLSGRAKARGASASGHLPGG